MPIATFAAIDVGSNELAMKIFEVSKKYGIRELDYIRHSIALGADTYTNGKISHPLVNEVCEVLSKFTEKMLEYQVSDYNACCTSAIREAQNSQMIMDQIKLRCGLKVKILSNSEQRFLCYKAIALKETAFNKIISKGTAIVDVGAGSIQISLFDKGALISTQNIKLGSLRIREVLAALKDQTTDFKKLVSEYADNDILTYRDLFLKKNEIKNIIAIGDYLNDMKKFDTAKNEDSQTRAQFDELYKRLSSLSTDDIALEAGISYQQAELILPAAMIYHKLFTETGAELIWFPGVTLCDAIVAEYAEKKEKIIPTHNFGEDILAAAKNIAKRYQCDQKHTDHVAKIALQIFDSIRKIHGLGKRERLLLQIAVILHNCGEYINMNKVQENSYHIIMSTEIIGLSHLERVVIANIVRYHTHEFPNQNFRESGLDKESYIKIAKLTAILRIANAMDKSHKQKCLNIRTAVNQNELIITIDTLADITLERGLFEQKADFFEEVYGIRPILRQKRNIGV